MAAWSSISSRVSAFCVGRGGMEGALPDDACASTSALKNCDSDPAADALPDSSPGGGEEADGVAA